MLCTELAGSDIRKLLRIMRGPLPVDNSEASDYIPQLGAWQQTDSAA